MSLEHKRPAGLVKRRLARAAAVSMTIAVACSPLRPTLAESPSPVATTAASPVSIAESPGAAASVAGTIVYERTDHDGDPEKAYTIAPDGASDPRVLLTAQQFYCCPQFSPDGSRVAASTPGGQTLSAVTVNTDGTGYSVMPLPDKTIILAPGLWLDAKEVTFTGWDDSDPSRNGMYVGDPGQPATLRRVTSSPGLQDQVVAVSADGTRIAFVRAAAGAELGPLFTVNADGTNVKQVSPAEALVSPAGGWGGSSATWSPDGSKLTFAATVGGCACAVYVVDVDGGNPRKVFASQGLIFGAHWSPDGRWIAFESQPADSTWDQVMLIHPDGTGLKIITFGGQEAGSWSPQWSPDGSKLVFQSGGRGGDYVDLWTSNADGSDPVQLTHDPGHYDTYSWGQWPPVGH